jgi:hypothetical protein
MNVIQSIKRFLNKNYSKDVHKQHSCLSQAFNPNQQQFTVYRKSHDSMLFRDWQWQTSHILTEVVDSNRFPHVLAATFCAAPVVARATNLLKTCNKWRQRKYNFFILSHIHSLFIHLFINLKNQTTVIFWKEKKIVPTHWGKANKIQWNFSKPDPQKISPPWISANIGSPCLLILCKKSLIIPATPLNQSYFLVPVLAVFEKFHCTATDLIDVMIWKF